MNQCLCREFVLARINILLNDKLLMVYGCLILCVKGTQPMFRVLTEIRRRNATLPLYPLIQDTSVPF